MDTEKGYARFTMLTPKKIDFTAIQTATHGAGYTITNLAIETSGIVTKASGTTSEKEALFLKVDKTGQLLEIDGDVEAGGHVRIRGSTTEWGKDVLGFFSPRKHIVLKVVVLDQEGGSRGG